MSIIHLKKQWQRNQEKEKLDNIFRKDSILSSGVLSSYSSKQMYVMLNSRTVNSILIISFTQALFNKRGCDHICNKLKHMYCLKVDKLLINVQQAVFQLYRGQEQICMNKTTIYKWWRDWLTGSTTFNCHGKRTGSLTGTTNLSCITGMAMINNSALKPHHLLQQLYE